MARVDFLHNPHDFQALVLGSLGFSSRFINETTGLTPSQIGYRLRKQSIRRTDYRNGESSAAHNVLLASQEMLAQEIRRRLGYGYKAKQARVA